MSGEILYPWLEPTWQQLCRCISQQRLPHALLLLGPKGVGKRALAEHLAAYLLCSAPGDKAACGRCRNCLLSQAEGGHPDIWRLAPDGKIRLIKVEQVREALSFFGQTALAGGYRIMIIEEADTFNTASANCLLKTLEEPGAKSLILLLSHAESLLLPTIKSRCQKVYCKADLTRAQAYLQASLGSCQFDFNSLWQLSGGAPLALKEGLEQGRYQLLYQFIEQLLGPFEPLALAQTYSKAAIADLVLALGYLVSDLIKCQQGLSHHVILSAFRHKLSAYSHQLNPERLDAYLQACYQAQDRIHRKVSINETLLLEDLLLNWQKISL